MLAPRAFACSYSSSITAPAPSRKHEAVAIAIPRPAGALRIVIARRQRPRLAEAAETQRRGRHLGAAGDHHVRVAVLDESHRQPDGVRRSRARSHRRQVRTGELEVDREVAGDHVDDAAGHEERRDVLRAVRLGVFAVVLLDRVEAADAGAHGDADALRILRRHLDAGVLDGVRRCTVAVVHERIHLAQLFRRQVRLRIEARDRPAKAHGPGAHVEARDRADAALAFEHVAPRRVDGAADGRDDAEAGDDDASLRQAITPSCGS